MRKVFFRVFESEKGLVMYNRGIGGLGEGVVCVDVFRLWRRRRECSYVFRKVGRI